MTWRADLRAIVEEIAASDIPDVLGELARAQAVIQLKLQPPRQDGAAPVLDQQLTVDEVADRLKVGTKWVYAHADQLGAVHLSARAIRFSERAIQRFIVARRHRP